MKNITVGYFDLSGKTFISAVEINKNFLNLLSRYVDVKIIPVAKQEEIEGIFSGIGNHKLDYFYIDSFSFLRESFLLREKLKLDIPFIFTIHTVSPWIHSYIYVVPLLRKYDVIFAPSTYAKEAFLRISDKFSVSVIPYSLDIKYIQKGISYRSKGQKNKIITFLGRLVEKKGIGTIIKCMPKIITKTNNVHLNIIGPLSGRNITDCPQSPYVTRLKRAVKRLRLSNRIHFKGVRFGLDKYRILSKSDIFVNPTIAVEEAFPTTNIEALACGVPIIATKWAGNNEIIEEGKNGYLIDVYYDKKAKIDTEQLISLATNVLRDKKLNLNLKRNALRTAERFDYHKVMPKLVKLLKKKTKVRIKNRWELIKNKRGIDFAHLFNRDFIFFLYYFYNFETQTYASLYKEITRRSSLKNKHLPDKKGVGKKKKNDKYTKITDKIRHNLLDFLLLRC